VSARSFGLDLLRCCAIGGVVFSHGMSFIYPYVPALPLGGGFALHLYHLGHFGSFGVELFFVLSGFLIGGIIWRDQEEIKQGPGLRRFYVRRWFRTLPNYYVFLLFNVCVFAHWAQLPPFLLFGQNLWANHVTFFPESWSLAVEEWFYLLFPLAFFGLSKMAARSRNVFLVAGVSFYLFSTLLRCAYASRPENDWAGIIRVIVLIRFDAIMTGVLAAWLAAQAPALFAAAPRLKAFAGAALAGFCYCTLYWHNAHNETFFARTFRFNLISLGFALLLPWAVRARARWTALAAPVRWIAIWSYAMYFLNLPVWYFLSHVAFPSSAHSPVQAWCAFAAMQLGVVALAALWYAGFERPMTALRDRFSVHGAGSAIKAS
jgi:peptidoglycan/LPS O-acetylase OafA/YrhL